MIGDNDKGLTRAEWWLSKIYPLVLSGGGSAFYGSVTTATSTTQFKVDSLKGMGTDLLNDVYYCQVIQADAAAPEGEIQKVSAYDTSDGDITVGAAFTVAPDVGDYVLILHESVVVPTVDSTENLLIKDVIGNKGDTSAIPSGTTSLVAGLKKVYDEVISITIAGELFYASSPANLEIDDIGNYNIGLYDVGDGIPTSAEIAAGNYQIDRVRNGALTNIVASTGASKADGRIYCSETFDAASGWATGDLVLVTFSGGSVTPTGGATTVLPNAYLYSRIVRGETIEGYTEKIYDVSFGTAPVDGSLASFIATGGTALGTRLAASKSLLDALGSDGTNDLDSGIMAQLQDYVTDDADSIYGRFGAYTGPVGGTAQDDNVKASLDLAHIDLDAIIANQAGEETISSYNLPNDTAENTAIEIINTKRLKLDSIWLDFVNLVQNVTIKVYHKIDGTTYRQYDEFSWGTSEEDGVLLRDVTINGDWKLTVTSTVAQGSILAIPYNVIKTTMEA